MLRFYACGRQSKRVSIFVILFNPFRVGLQIIIPSPPVAPRAIERFDHYVVMKSYTTKFPNLSGSYFSSRNIKTRTPNGVKLLSSRG
jgi:hypothetical protein